MDSIDATLLTSLTILATLPGALFAPLLASWGADQRLLGSVVVLVAASGILGCVVSPLSSVWLWSITAGVGSGASFAMALLLVVLRTKDATQAAQLSAMAQGIGYVLAAVVTLLVGLLHDMSGGWLVSAVLIAAIGFCGGLIGLGAGRARFVSEH
jgi:CP family cyanate transporter-like MFS transporter